MAQLQVFVDGECWAGAEAQRLVAETRVHFPEVDVTIINLETGEWPGFVFASPTYVLDGLVISLGNPDWGQLSRRLRDSGAGTEKRE